jgi:hypothetical protein
MLGTYGIVAASPELGTLDHQSYDFYIDNRTVVKELLN